VGAWIEMIWGTKHTLTSSPSDPFHYPAFIHPWCIWCYTTSTAHSFIHSFIDAEVSKLAVVFITSLLQIFHSVSELTNLKVLHTFLLLMFKIWMLVVVKNSFVSVSLPEQQQ
jgi:hypothetical protein